MTVCNMTIEGGGRAGMIAPDDTTFEWVVGRAGGAATRGRRTSGATLRTDDGARVRQGGRGRRGGALAAGHLGHDPGHGRARHRRPCPSRSDGDRRARAATTWTSSRARRSRTSGSTACSSARARTRGSATCARRPRCSSGRRVHPDVARDGRARLAAGEGAGRGGGPRRGLPRRRLRLALGRLLDVPGHEPGHPRSRASAAPPPRTATSRAARAAAAAPTSSARRWRPPRRSRATSSTSGSGA